MATWNTLDGRPTRIIAHRGASGLRPEHTRVGYELAIAQGADLIEPDLLPSRDGVLMTRHDLGLARSTDIARRRSLAVHARMDRQGRRDWQIQDFDREALETLRAIQPFAGRSKAFDTRHPLIDFEAVLDIAKSHRSSARPVGIYPELKHPTLLAGQGFDVTGMAIEVLQRRGHGGKQDPVWMQCFEVEPLRRIHATLALPVFLLIEPAEVGAAQDLNDLHRRHDWLDGIALPKSAVIGRNGSALRVRIAHELGWQVHVWTLRDDQVLPEFENVQQELGALFEAGVDALFADFPETAVRARAAMA